MAGDVLLGKEKIQKILLARLTETVVMWLSDEQEFWGVFEDDTGPLQPLGLQQVLTCFHTVHFLVVLFEKYYDQISLFHSFSYREKC